MLSRMNKRMRGQGGFTLIELLVVIIIIAILAAIAIPTFLGQRQKALDAAAKSLVRNAMTAVESAYVDTRSYASDADNPITEDMLEDIEPSIAFTVAAGSGAASEPSAEAAEDAVDVGLVSATQYEVGTVSQSGKTFGVAVDKGEDGGNTFFIGKSEADW